MRGGQLDRRVRAAHREHADRDDGAAADPGVLGGAGGQADGRRASTSWRKELAKRLGVDKVVVRTEDFSKIVAGDLGDADVALALITPTDARREVLDFTSPYLEAAPTLLVKGDREVADVQTAQELRWVVGANTTFVDIVDDVIRPDAPPVQIEDRDEEVRMVADGEADVAMFDLPAAAAIVEQEPGLSMAAQLSDTEPIAAALPKGSPNTQAVGSAMRAMDNDGTRRDGHRALARHVDHRRARATCRCCRTDDP